MPALTIPSNSSLGSFQSGLNATDQRRHGISNNNNNRNGGVNPSSSSASSTSVEGTKVPGTLRIDTRQSAMMTAQMQGNKKAAIPNVVSSTSPVVKSEQIKSNTMSPIAATDSIENIQRKLKHNLARHAQNGDRRMVSRTLQNCKFLHNIPITRSTATAAVIPPLSELEKLAGSQPVEFNGMLLGAGKEDHNNASAAVALPFSRNGRQRIWSDPSEIPAVLREVCARLVRNPELQNGPTEEALYRAVLLRLSKLQSSQDSHSQLTATLATPPDINLHVPKKPWKPLGRTQAWLYASGGNVHFVCKTHHAYGLFRKSDAVNRPWIGLTATVHERINLTTGASVERIALQVHEDKYSL